TGRREVGLGVVEGSKEAGALVRGLVEEGGVSFCTDEGSQRRREVGEMVAAERGKEDGTVIGRVNGGEKVGEEGVKGEGYGVDWCVNALEVEGGDLLKARGWLKDWAPTREEEKTR
ncbi:MAG: hypothetical protein Q9184_007689, partial [Pyrenodesmia sp. 2 TL-2023]